VALNLGIPLTSKKRLMTEDWKVNEHFALSVFSGEKAYTFFISLENISD